MASVVAILVPNFVLVTAIRSSTAGVLSFSSSRPVTLCFSRSSTVTSSGPVTFNARVYVVSTNREAFAGRVTFTVTSPTSSSPVALPFGRTMPSASVGVTNPVRAPVAELLWKNDTEAFSTGSPDSSTTVTFTTWPAGRATSPRSTSVVLSTTSTANTSGEPSLGMNEGLVMSADRPW